MGESTKSSILLCQLQQIPICITRDCITKAILLPTFTSVPNAPKYLAGLINLAGQSMPLIDLAFRLGLCRTEPYATNTPVLVCKHDQTSVAVIVDEILGFIDVDNQAMSRDGLTNNLFLATYTIGTTIALLIDIPKMINEALQDLQPLAQRQA